MPRQLKETLSTCRNCPYLSPTFQGGYVWGHDPRPKNRTPPYYVYEPDKQIPEWCPLPEANVKKINGVSLTNRDWSIILAALRVYERFRPGVIDAELQEYLEDIESNGGMYDLPDLTPNGDVDRICEVINTSTERTWQIEVSRTAYFGTRVYEVQAPDAKTAQKLAEEQAANDLWTEKSSDYEIESTQVKP